METLFLACFAFGLLFTLASLVLGFVGGGFGHGAHAPGAHHGAHFPHGHANGSARDMGLPLLNASSVLGALTWFGAAGYLLTTLGTLALPLVLLGALAVGALAWYLVARFLGLILKGQVEMDPEDYRLEGTVGTLTVSIPAGGTGEIVFSKAGLTRSEAARAVGGEAIPRGSEVVITAYDKGFATVQPWGQFLAEREKLPSRNAQSAKGKA